MRREMDGTDFFRGSRYNIIRVLLSMSGLWPFHSAIKRCRTYLGFLLVVGPGLTCQIMGIIEVWSNPFEVVDCIPLIIYAILPLTKQVYMIYNISKIKILLLKIKEHWRSPKTDEETKILQSHAVYGEKFGYIYTGVFIGNTVLFLCTTLLSKLIHTQPNEEFDKLGKIQGAPKGLPYRVNYMLDLDTYYIPIFIHTAMCEMLYLLLIILQDVLYLTLVQYCCGLLAALRYLLENTLQFKDNNDNLAVASDGRCYANIVYIIRRHAEAIHSIYDRFIHFMESLFSLPLLVHMGSIVSILSIIGFQILTNISDMSLLMRHSIYLCGAIINAFFQNWQGQKIIDYSEKVYEYAYNAQWYDMPNATKKLLILIMLRSMKPFQITAGKIIVMSYENFNAVMRASSSYFMLLRSIQ